jgi:hypothetical protein
LRICLVKLLTQDIERKILGADTISLMLSRLFFDSMEP